VLETTPARAPVDNASFPLFKRWDAAVGEGGDRLLKEFAGGLVKTVASYKGEAGGAMFPISEFENLMALANAGGETPEELVSMAGMSECERAKQHTSERRGSMMTYKTCRTCTIMRVAGSATSAMRKPQKHKRVRNDEA
jgi:hypothetical protein